MPQIIYFLPLVFYNPGNGVSIISNPQAISTIKTKPPCWLVRLYSSCTLERANRIGNPIKMFKIVRTFHSVKGHKTAKRSQSSRKQKENQKKGGRSHPTMATALLISQQ